MAQIVLQPFKSKEEARLDISFILSIHSNSSLGFWQAWSFYTRLLQVLGGMEIVFLKNNLLRQFHDLSSKELGIFFFFQWHTHNPTTVNEYNSLTIQNGQGPLHVRKSTQSLLWYHDAYHCCCQKNPVTQWLHLGLQEYSY